MNVKISHPIAFLHPAIEAITSVVAGMVTWQKG